jgi:hypothetical protein
MCEASADLDASILEEPCQRVSEQMQVSYAHAVEHVVNVLDAVLNEFGDLGCRADEDSQSVQVVQAYLVQIERRSA